MKRSLARPLLLLAFATCIAMVFSVGIGSVSVSPGDVMAVFLRDGSDLQRTLVLELRFPRTMAAFATGGLLAVAGALMQVLLRNPLADPYVLGLSGGAAVGALLAMLPGMLYWLMGDVSYAPTPWPGLTLLVLVCLLVFPLGRSLNVLARGPMQAAALGVSVRPLEWTLYILASLLTATAVTIAGSVGFVGLVVPHMLRLLLGNDQRLILPACALGGGTLLVLADTLARVVIAPEQLPVGVITALLGVPTFLYLPYRSR